MLFYVINLILQFFSRKIFLDYLGAEVLGLNTTIQSVLQFLNLAELGIGTAVAFTLYKPIAQKNREEITEIVSLQGYFYRKIAYITIAAALVLLGFFPWLFAKAEVPLWYAYATFVVMLAWTLGSYVFNYRQILLSADQKEYKILIPSQTVRTIKTLLQVVAIMTLPHGYIAWLVLELLATVVTVYAINRNVGREYPWLNTDIRQGAELRKKYPDVLTKTKQLFFHKVAGFTLQCTTIPIIYAYASLTLAAVYGNYLLIVQGVTLLVNAIYNSITAGIGNLVAEGDKSRIMTVFHEFFTSRFLLSSVICFGVYLLADPFIVLWVGREYLLDPLSLVLIVATLFINLSRGAVETFILAYGLYQDVWSPVVEAILNVGFALLLGWFWGLPGILGGVFISLIAIVFFWKPYMLFRRGFQLPVRRYAVMYLRHAVVLAVVGMIAVYLLRFVSTDPAQSLLHFMIYTVLTVGSFGLLLGALLYATEQGMRDFVKRIMFIKK